MNQDLAQQAIKAAVEGDWETAIRLNSTLISENSADIEAMLRLGHAFSQVGKKKEATVQYEKVLNLDRYNIFATRGLVKLKKIKKSQISEPHELKTEFVEEPGKTKIVDLVNVAAREVLAQLDSGECILLVPRKHRISATTESGVYIGRLPDDLSVRLLGFISGGNKYEAAVKAVNTKQIKIFIRETSRALKFEQTPSFSYDGNSFQEEQI